MRAGELLVEVVHSLRAAAALAGVEWGLVDRLVDMGIELADPVNAADPAPPPCAQRAGNLSALVPVAPMTTAIFASFIRFSTGYCRKLSQPRLSLG